MQARFLHADFAGDLADSKSTSGGRLCIFGDHTFAISWACEKQTAVSHSSPEAEVISLDTGLVMEGIHASKLWEAIIDVSQPPATRATGVKARQKSSHSNTQNDIRITSLSSGFFLSRSIELLFFLRERDRARCM